MAGEGQEVVRVAPVGDIAVQDHIALAEIDLCGDLIIAASATHEDRLSMESIDEILKVVDERRPASRPSCAYGM